MIFTEQFKAQIKKYAITKYGSVSKMCQKNKINDTIFRRHLNRGYFSKKIAKLVIIALPSIDKDKIKPYTVCPDEIKTERKRIGLTQKDFGELFGVSATTICSWESGKKLPLSKNYIRFIGVFKSIKNNSLVSIRTAVNNHQTLSFFENRMELFMVENLKKQLKKHFGTIQNCKEFLFMGTSILYQFEQRRLSMKNAKKINSILPIFGLDYLCPHYKKGAEIKERRVESGLSIQDVSDHLKISTTTLLKYEQQGLTRITDHQLSILKNIFKDTKIKSNSATSIKWNKVAKRIQVAFKPADMQYFGKWQKVHGQTNIEKIKFLLDNKK